jgi:hypothetical protein
VAKGQSELGEILFHPVLTEKIGISSMHDNIGAGSIF